jgi:hypothetical protein
VAAGLERARGFTWEETARRTVDVYLKVLKGGASRRGPVA